MKHLLLILTLSTFIACKEKKEEPQPKPDIFETKDCDYTLPDGYKMLCHDKRNIYIIKVNDSSYYSKYRREDNHRIVIFIDDVSVGVPRNSRYDRLTHIVHLNDFEHALKFEDSCKAKGYVKQMLLEQEEYRISEEMSRKQHISDSITAAEETTEHFKECTK